MRFTVLGASGFIGSHLVRHLRGRGLDCLAPDRNDGAVFEEDLGHVVYCIGLTADFRRRLLDTVDAHVCRLLECLRRCRFDSFLYLSSTRVYSGAPSGREDEILRVNPQDPGDVYNLSKLMGEATCFAAGHPRVRVVRLSNVYGPDWRSDNFLVDVIRSAVGQRRVVFGASRDSAKDYISIDDVVSGLTSVALGGRHGLYNLAAGRNVTNGVIADRLRAAAGCEVAFAEGARTVVFPPIDIGRMSAEFGFAPARLEDDLEKLVESYRKERPCA